MNENETIWTIIALKQINADTEATLADVREIARLLGIQLKAEEPLPLVKIGQGEYAESIHVAPEHRRRDGERDSNLEAEESEEQAERLQNAKS